MHEMPSAWAMQQAWGNFLHAAGACVPRDGASAGVFYLAFAHQPVLFSQGPCCCALLQRRRPEGLLAAGLVTKRCQGAVCMCTAHCTLAVPVSVGGACKPV